MENQPLMVVCRLLKEITVIVLTGRDMEKQLKFTLKKSMIGSTRKIRATLIGLGLTRVNKTIIRKNTPEIRGMLKKVQHLVEVED